jgi:xanthine dehydrogenase accessory factor
MREIAAEVRRWRQEGKPVAVATVARVHGSGLRPLGAKLACTSTGQIAGSVSGGCVEGAVYEEAQEVLAGGAPRLLEYGVSDQAAWEVGLACGGTIEVWVEALDDDRFGRLTACVDAGERVARSTVVAGPVAVGNTLVVWPDGQAEGDPGPADLRSRLEELTRRRLAAGDPRRCTVEVAEGSVEVLTEVWGPPPRLVVVGAVHLAIPLVTMAKALGYHTVVVDARAAFATRERFPHVDELIVAWPPKVLDQLRPDRSTDVVVLTHDDKVDVPTLRGAVRSKARYVGVLGSTGHQAQRAAALRELGVTDEELARIHAPIGLRLGAVGAEEIAVSILAELVATRHGTGARTAPATGWPADSC